MIGTRIARASALTVGLAGIFLLFIPDVLLPRVVPAFPPAAAWLGQLIGAGWLGLATLNWRTQNLLIGGVYGRPVVMANAGFYFISTMVLGKAISRTHPAMLLVVVFAVCAIFAIAYGWLLYRGPFAKDFAARREQTDAAGSVR